MLDIKRQQFRAKQRQNLLNDIFQQKRKFIQQNKSLEQLNEVLSLQNFDSLQYQQTIEQILQMSQYLNLSPLYKNLVNSYLETLKYPMDLGYYVISIQIVVVLINQMELDTQPDLLHIISIHGIKKFVEFHDPLLLQFLELFLIQQEQISEQDIQDIYNEIMQWSQSINFQYVIQALYCLKQLIKKNNYLLTSSLIEQLLPLLSCEYSQLALEIFQYSNWTIYTDEQMAIIWDSICRLLLLHNQEEHLCLNIMQQMILVYQPYQFKEIIEYLSFSDNIITQKILKILSKCKINRNYDFISQQLLDKMCYKILQDYTLIPFLKEFISLNQSLYEFHNYPKQIEQLLLLQ